ncbi:hypothetical protein D3C78_1732360 [compost metagenome]
MLLVDQLAQVRPGGRGAGVVVLHHDVEQPAQGVVRNQRGAPVEPDGRRAEAVQHQHGDDM